MPFEEPVSVELEGLFFVVGRDVIRELHLQPASSPWSFGPSRAIPGSTATVLPAQSSDATPAARRGSERAGVEPRPPATPQSEAGQGALAAIACQRPRCHVPPVRSRTGTPCAHLLGCGHRR